MWGAPALLYIACQPIAFPLSVYRKLLTQVLSLSAVGCAEILTRFDLTLRGIGWIEPRFLSELLVAQTKVKEIGSILVGVNAESDYACRPGGWPQWRELNERWEYLMLAWETSKRWRNWNVLYLMKCKTWVLGNFCWIKKSIKPWSNNERGIKQNWETKGMSKYE